LTIFEDFFNDFSDFLSWPAKNLTMGGKTNKERSCLRAATLEEQGFGLRRPLRLRSISFEERFA
jgi:hypothetical protein